MERGLVVFFKQEKGKLDEYREIFERQHFQVQFAKVLDFSFVNEKELAGLLANANVFENVVLSSVQSVNAMENMFKTNTELLQSWETKNYFVVGKKTRDSLVTLFGHELVKIQVEDNAEKLVNILRDESQNLVSQQSLILSGNKALKTIPLALEEMNVPFKKLVVYQTTTNPPEIDFEQLWQSSANVWLCFFSPSGVESVLRTIPTSLQDKFHFIALGPSTSAALKKWNVKKLATATLPSATSMLKCVE